MSDKVDWRLFDATMVRRWDAITERAVSLPEPLLTCFTEILEELANMLESLGPEETPPPGWFEAWHARGKARIQALRERGDVPYS